MLEIARRVERERVTRGVEVKTVCADIGMGKDEWSRKVRATRSTFSVMELGILADLWACPVGWPFVDAERGKALEALEAEALRRLAHPREPGSRSVARTNRK